MRGIPKVMLVGATVGLLLMLAGFSLLPVWLR